MNTSTQNKSKIYLKIVILWVLFVFFTILIAVLSQALGVPVEFGFAQFGPGLVALIAVLVLQDKNINRSNFPSDPYKPKLQSFIFMFIITVVLSLVLSLAIFSSGMKYQKISQIDGFNLWFIVIWMPFGAIGEEIGWRSYLQRVIEPHFSGIKSYLILGLLWTMWHISNYVFGLLFMIGQLLLLVGISVILGKISNERGNNLLFATFSHICINISIFLNMYLGLVNIVWLLLYGLVVFVISLWYFNRTE